MEFHTFPDVRLRSRRRLYLAALAACLAIAAMCTMGSQPGRVWFLRGVEDMTREDALWLLQHGDADPVATDGAVLVLMRDARRSLIVPLAELSRRGNDKARAALLQIRALSDEALR